jgi:hypothetical protein
LPLSQRDDRVFPSGRLGEVFPGFVTPAGEERAAH